MEKDKGGVSYHMSNNDKIIKLHSSFEESEQQTRWLFTENFPEERLKNVCASAPFTPQPEFLGKRDGPVIVIEPAFIF